METLNASVTASGTKSRGESKGQSLCGRLWRKKRIISRMHNPIRSTVDEGRRGHRERKRRKENVKKRKKLVR